MGGILELLGLLGVAKGISDVRRHFGLDSTFSEALADFQVAAQKVWERTLQALSRKPAPQTIQLGTVHLTATAHPPEVHVTGPPPDMSLEAQITRLQQRLDGLDETLSGVRDELHQGTSELRDTINSERQAREADHEQLGIRLQDFAVGGLRLQTVGLVWLLAGVILATWAS